MLLKCYKIGTGELPFIWHRPKCQVVFVVTWTYQMKGNNDSLEGNKKIPLDFCDSSSFRNKKHIGKSAV